MSTSSIFILAWLILSAVCTVKVIFDLLGKLLHKFLNCLKRTSSAGSPVASEGVTDIDNSLCE